MRTRNPAFRNPAFVGALPDTEAMTVRGTVQKTAGLGILVLTSALWSWSQVRAGSPAVPAIMGVGLVGDLAVALVTIFKRSWAGVTSPIYALLEGLVLGALSAIFE